MGPIQPIVDYKKHTQERFLERFNKILSDEDYYKLCEIGKDDTQGYLLEQVKRGAKRKIVVYNDVMMWCVFSGKKRILKTLYMVPNKIVKKLNSIYNLSMNNKF